MSTLATRVHALASEFAAAVLAAVRGASLEQLVAGIGGTAPARRRTEATNAAPRSPTKTSGSAREPTVNPASPALDRAVAILRAAGAAGMRSEHARAALKLTRKKFQTLMAQGVGAGKVRRRGERRATTYFAA